MFDYRPPMQSNTPPKLAFVEHLKLLVAARTAARQAYHAGPGDGRRSLAELRTQWENASAAVERFAAQHDRRRMPR